MTKPELGAKRLCAHCGAKFYDLHHSPITCPKCGRVFEPMEASSRFRAEAAREPVREVEPVSAESPRPTSYDAEAQGEKKPGGAPEAEGEVEPDDEGLDDAALIEESEQEDGDFTEIVGDDSDIEDGNDIEKGN